MARENKTKYALLGLLAWSPMSGYDIKKVVEQGLRYFWNESYGQIYPIMKQLADEGLATAAVERTAGKPDRHVYSITDTGRAELRRWLARPAEPARERVEMLLKLFYGEHVPVAVSIEHVQRFRDEHAALLAEYERMEVHIHEAHMDHSSADFGLLTLRCGIHHSRAYVAWCDEALAMLKTMANKAYDGAPPCPSTYGASSNPRAEIQNPKSEEVPL